MEGINSKGRPARRWLYPVAIAAAVVVPAGAVVGVAAALTGGFTGNTAAPTPVVTRTVTAEPTTPPPAPVITDIPIANPDDPLLADLTADPGKRQACEFFLGNINSDDWATIDRFISLFATAATLTADPELLGTLEEQVTQATETGIPDNDLIAEAVSICTDGAQG